MNKDPAAREFIRWIHVGDGENLHTRSPPRLFADFYLFRGGVQGPIAVNPGNRIIVVSALVTVNLRDRFCVRILCESGRPELWLVLRNTLLQQALDLVWVQLIYLFDQFEEERLYLLQRWGVAQQTHDFRMASGGDMLTFVTEFFE